MAFGAQLGQIHTERRRQLLVLVLSLATYWAVITGIIHSADRTMFKAY